MPSSSLISRTGLRITLWDILLCYQEARRGQAIQLAAPIDTLALFVRAGSIVPLGEAIESTSQVQKIAKLRVYPGADET